LLEDQLQGKMHESLGFDCLAVLLFDLLLNWFAKL
jgi:hypothetical protein